MSELSGSSEIRDCLFDLESEGDSDVFIEEGNDDLSTSSGDLFEFRLSDVESDSEDDSGQTEQENTVNSDEGDSDNDNVVLHTGPKWTRAYPPEPDTKVEEKFKVRNPGIQNCPPRNSPPLLYFYLFFTSAVWNLLVRETNKYARENTQKKRDSGTMGPYSRLQRWTDVTVSEMKKFISLVINMGLNHKNNIERYWSTYKSQNIPFFSSVISLNRFEIINSMLHISSNPYIPPGQQGHDPWYKVRTFLDSMNSSFKKYFIPYQNLSIDESMIGMKNRFVHIMYMPNKRHARFGIKKFEVVDSKHNYIIHTELYSGKNFLADWTDPFTEKVVVHLLTVSNLFNKGYHIFTDNFYTKIPLAKRLFASDTFLTGTINKNSKDLSKLVLNTKLAPQTSVYFRKREILLVGYKQKPSRKPVYLITTGCHAEDKVIRSKSGKENIKPVLIHKYNLHMGGVDCKDKSVYHVTCDRATRRYWKKIFFNLLDMVLFDAYILYSLNTDRPLEREIFMISILEALVDEETLQNNQPGPSGGDLGHQLARLPGKKLRLCPVCSTSEKKSRSHFWCPGCNCGVHQHCFHKLQHYWRPMKAGRKRTHHEDVSD